MVYGLKEQGSQWRPLRSVIGEVETTRSGNVTLRIGRELGQNAGWEMTEYVVLTPIEAVALVDEIDAALNNRGLEPPEPSLL